MLVSHRVLVAAMVGIVACRAREQSTSDTASVAPADSTPSAAASHVTPRGIGPLEIGMNLRQARAVVPGLELPPGSDASGCEFAKAPGLAGVLVMVENGIVVRIDVDTNAIATAEGVRIGDAITRAQSVYGSRLSTAPNKYSSEPELHVRSSIPDDTLHEIVFETKAGRIRHYHAGQRPHVRYVEGCA